MPQNTMENHNIYKQGTCLLTYTDDIRDKNDIPLKSNAIYTLISQDCDIVNTDSEKEPYVDLLLTKQNDTATENYRKGKNPRILHLNLDTNVLEYSIHDIVSVPKENLCKFEYDSSVVVTGENLSMLVSWLSNRYSRTAYPDEFNRRLRRNKTDKKIEKIMSQYGGNTKGIFVLLNTYGELPAESNYEFEFILLVEPRYYENEVAMEMIDECLEKIARCFDKLDEIKLISYKIRSMEDISLYDFLKYKKWDLDYLSYNENADGALGPKIDA